MTEERVLTDFGLVEPEMARAIEKLTPVEGAAVWRWGAEQRSAPPDAAHEPHHGNHEGYACGLSGPHCWACNEPWPCRASRAKEEPT